MLSVKGGTQTWSTAPQQVDLGSDGARSLSAQEKEMLGGQEVGDVLNKISDPNYVETAKKVRKVGNNQLDKDAFMKLLLTQMKNQDPTNPLQSHEMAAQLAQFTSLEKLTNINEGIDGLQKAQVPAQNFEALNLLGKMVNGDSSKIDRADEKDTHEIVFNLAADAVNADVQIKGPDGKVVRTLAAANLKAGRNEILWNGVTEDGTSAPKGPYTVAIEAHSSSGRKVFADTKFDGLITGVNFTSAGPILMVGKQQISMKDVKEIIDPRFTRPESVNRLEVKGDAPQAADGKKPVAKSPAKPASNENKIVADASNNLESVGMSRGMINQLAKSGPKVGI